MLYNNFDNSSSSDFFSFKVTVGGTVYAEDTVHIQVYYTVQLGAQYTRRILYNVHIQVYYIVQLGVLYTENTVHIHYIGIVNITVPGLLLY